MDGTIIFTVLGGSMPTIEQLQNEIDEIKRLTERLGCVSRALELIPFAMERKYEEPNEHRNGKVLLDVYGPSDEGESRRKEAHVSLTPEQVGLIDEALMKEKRALSKELEKRRDARIVGLGDAEPVPTLGQYDVRLDPSAPEPTAEQRADLAKELENVIAEYIHPKPVIAPSAVLPHLVNEAAVNAMRACGMDVPEELINSARESRKAALAALPRKDRLRIKKAMCLKN